MDATVVKHVLVLLYYDILEVKDSRELPVDGKVPLAWSGTGAARPLNLGVRSACIILFYKRDQRIPVLRTGTSNVVIVTTTDSNAGRTRAEIPNSYS
jgi:hypothetical protein